jgi:ribonuclease HI
MAHITIHTDGLCEPVNPGGTACWAWVATSPAGKQLTKASGVLGHGPEMTNNLAEYEAVLQALRYTIGRAAVLVARDLGVELRSDSQLIVYQITGRYQTNAVGLRPLRDEARSFIEQLNAAGVPTAIIWIPRTLNVEADVMTRQTYAAAKGQAYATR